MRLRTTIKWLRNQWVCDACALSLILQYCQCLEYVESNGRTFDERWIGRDVKGNCHGLFTVLSQHLLGRTEGKQQVLRRTNRLLFLIRQGPHSKLRAQQFFCCCVCIRYCSNVSTEPLPSNGRGNFTEPLPSNNKGDTLSSIRHGRHWKQRLQQVFCCCMCIHYRGNVSTEPLPSNNMGIHRLMGGIF
jgi:hypothetical protein